jgi:hypothetical protein
MVAFSVKMRSNRGAERAPPAGECGCVTGSASP